MTDKKLTNEQAINVLDVLWYNPLFSEEHRQAFEIGIKAIKALEQESKTGHWIVVSDGYGDNSYICECSECKDTVWIYKDADRTWNYCPNCGAKMQSESEG